MSKEYERYYKELQGWDWDALKDECEEYPEEDDCGERRGQIFVGTVFNLMPSGKYYTPYANSNVDTCSRCGGKGDVDNPRGKKRSFERLTRRCQRTTRNLIKQYGAWPCWPETAQKKLDLLRAKTARYDYLVSCPQCHGVGSHEAFLDQEFRQALEDVAEEHGCWVTEGKGDPCDVFIGCTLQPVEEEQEEEEAQTQED